MPNDVRKLVDKYFSKCHQIIQKTQKDMEIVHDTNLKLLKEAGFAEIAASFVRLQRCNAARYVIGVDARRVHRLQQCNNTTILYQVICYNNYNNYKCISSYLLQQLQQLQVYIKLSATNQVICYNNYNNYKCLHNKVFTSSYKLSLTDDESTP